MRVIFSGGGTAGHIYPAIAIAEIIEKKHPNSEFLFIGRMGGEENNAIIKNGYSLKEIDVIGLGKKCSLRNALALFKAVKGVSIAKRIIRDFAPDVVIGTGGYVSFPALVASIQLKIPTIIHESNAIPGIVTRLLAKHVDCVMLGFGSCRERLTPKARSTVSGNPVRCGFKRYDKREAKRRLGISPLEFVVLSFGGSLGAEKLNDTIVDLATTYKKRGGSICHIHASGRRYHETMQQKLGENNCTNEIRLLSYIEDMPLYLSAADIAITRSGAITVAELISTATPSILIPSPNVSENHQLKNALAIREIGGAFVIEESEIDAELLFEKITELKTSRDLRNDMAKALDNARREAPEDSIVEAIEEIIAGKRK